MPWELNKVRIDPRTGQRRVCDVYIPAVEDLNRSELVKWKQTLGESERYPPVPKPVRPPIAPAARSNDPAYLISLPANELNDSEQRIVASSINTWKKANP